MVIFAAMDSQYMKRCLELALRGSGYVSPNPLVGCVIVENNFIIGEGYHTAFGEPHAEVMAISSVEDPSRLKNATLYVNLEPCAHHGKTPPCAPMIVEKGIRKVVIANRDPFAEVDGKGMSLLREAGVEVVTDCEKEAGWWLNRRFFTFHTKKRPYLIIKAAQSANGMMDTDRLPEDRGVNWITAPETQYLTHRWRTEEDAILVGTRTALIDNPELTARKHTGPSPHRLLIDRELQVTSTFSIFKGDVPTTVFNGTKDGNEGNLTWVQLDFEESIIPQILAWCYRANLQSILVEGGAQTIAGFVESQAWDEARIITGRPVFEKGLPTPEIGGHGKESFDVGFDRVNIITRLP